MEHIDLYTFKVDWFYRWAETPEEEEQTTCGVVAANSYAEAAEKIDKRFPDAHNIFLDEYSDQDFIFLTKGLFHQLRTNEYGLGEE